MLLHQVFDERGQGLRGSLLGTRRIVGADAAQVADEVFGEFAELMRLVGCGHGKSRLRESFDAVMACGNHVHASFMIDGGYYNFRVLAGMTACRASAW